ncbi:MAG: fatty acyl-AMP ligase [Myxococcales bacterium]
MKGPPAFAPKFASLAEMLEKAGHSDRALVFVDRYERERRLTFADLASRARHAAATLASLGVRPGDRVALVLPTSPAFMDSFFGALLAGAIPVPLYPPVRLGRLGEYHPRTARMLSAVGARLVVSDDRIRRLLGEAVALARPELGLVDAAALPTGRTEIALENRAGDLALIQFSSGTTVDCKPVALSHANLLSNVAAIDGLLPTDAEARAGVSWLPLYHDMGLIGALLEALYRPGDLVLIPPELFLARPALWLRAISRHRATVSPAPNFAYGLCTKRIRDEELAGVDLSCWRLALDGAEPVTASVLRAFSERFARWGFRAEALTPVYGLSEAALAVSFSTPGRPFSVARVDPEILAREGRVQPGRREMVSVGRPLAGVELELRDLQGETLGEGRAGRIHVRSPGVMQGYFGAPTATGAALAGGWLDTGDLGFVLDGELYVCGRAKELVIVRGANRPPHEFEECMEGLAGVRAGCAVAFGFLDEGGEQLVVLAETEGPSRPDLARTIAGRIAERTGVRPAVVELLVPGTLPRTSSGKLRRAEAARLWQAGALAPPSQVNALTLALAALKGRVVLWRTRAPK